LINIDSTHLQTFFEYKLFVAHNFI